MSQGSHEDWRQAVYAEHDESIILEYADRPKINPMPFLEQIAAIEPPAEKWSAPIVGYDDRTNQKQLSIENKINSKLQSFADWLVEKHGSNGVAPGYGYLPGFIMIPITQAHPY